MFLAAFTITAFGIVLAARMKNMQSFFGLMQMAIMPMIFLSGAMFPLASLPSWLQRAHHGQPADVRGGPDAAGGLRPPRRHPRR